MQTNDTQKVALINIEIYTQKLTLTERTDTGLEPGLVANYLSEF